ncbi:hypothetical protein PybrP1_011785 [[Pythium] brassicae (nom. inval.)]|nr:hypothetical protein PybrP1_011785 [[Pythium] brassicae (nom. inval.)]
MTAIERVEEVAAPVAAAEAAATTTSMAATNMADAVAKAANAGATTSAADSAAMAANAAATNTTDAAGSSAGAPCATVEQTAATETTASSQHAASSGAGTMSTSGSAGTGTDISGAPLYDLAGAENPAPDDEMRELFARFRIDDRKCLATDGIKDGGRTSAGQKFTTRKHHRTRYGRPGERRPDMYAAEVGDCKMVDVVRRRFRASSIAGWRTSIGRAASIRERYQCRSIATAASRGS